ncbi:MAG: ABC-F family ATP-binding cassette domain-containing protein [Bacilli bacterium]|nr:ABC-F family ATP-binding cassette domain-containing protein [Bacilli bacterium]
MIVNLESVSKNYGMKTLFSNINLTIEEKDKIGIIGNNGTGKTTLLKVIAGTEEPDFGRVIYGPLIKISFLSQNLELNEEMTVYEQAISDYDGKLDELQDHEVKSALTKLGLTNWNVKVSTLSGGQKRRLALAKTLIRPADLLILDEATNHLDGEMILWLEKFLLKFPKSLLMVTHDRYFLERIVNKIVELENGTISTYPANYSHYLELKLEKETMLSANQRKLEAFLRKEQQWISRGPRARTTKDKRRINQFEELSQITFTKKPDLNLESTASRLGKKTIEMVNVSKSYHKPIIQNFSFIVPNDARIGMVGNNGCGKTTLLKIMAQIVEPDSGEVNVGETVKIGFFSQENEALDDSLRIVDFIKGNSEYVKSKDVMLSATQMIEKFLFDNPYSLIGTLSGGEKRRLMLLALLMSAPNILLLDEPTNNLDITTMNILENYLEDFQGAVIVASHDRYFLDKVCDRIFVFTDDYSLQAYLGSYSEYLSNVKIAKATPSREQNSRIKQPPIKLSFHEQQEYATIEDEIGILEEKLQLLNKQIETNFENYDILKGFYGKQQELESKINAKLERWEYLSEKEEASKRGNQ